MARDTSSKSHASRSVGKSDADRHTKNRTTRRRLTRADRLSESGNQMVDRAIDNDQVFIQRPFLHDFPTGHVDENGIVLHAAKLGGADQAVSGTGERRT